MSEAPPASLTHRADAFTSEGAPDSGVPFEEAVRTWVRVALLSFGGPAGQIAVMHRILVEEKQWVSETRFLHALNYCMLLPGPEAHELAIYIGWLLHRIRGGLVAGILFVLPGLVVLTALSIVYAEFGGVGVVQGFFFGLKAAVLAVVLEAVVRVGKRALKSRGLMLIAAAAFLAIFVFGIPFPIIIAAAAATGYLGHKAGLKWFANSGTPPASTRLEAAADHAVAPHLQPSLRRFLTTSALGCLVWLAPAIVLLAIAGPQNVFTSIALFNSKMAVVTFGGAYAVLAYMAQQAVQHYHWLRPGEMLVGLGFAESTPGPLISVVQFVGFMAAFRHAAPLQPIVAAILGGSLAMWCTFVPPFIWIFAGGPYIEALTGNRSFSAALSGITAAVVGVILNLAIWFALHILFRQMQQLHPLRLALEIPVLDSVSVPALVIAAAAVIALFRFKIGMIPVLGASCVMGALWFLAHGAT
jgi:chromate transporter